MNELQPSGRYAGSHEAPESTVDRPIASKPVDNPALSAMFDPAELRFVLRDIAFGAQMMLEIPGPADSPLKRYAAEVKRVADLALKGE